MSTRAIVTATSERDYTDKEGEVHHLSEHWSLYCHGDGYPSCLGELVLDFAKLAPTIDPNNHEHFYHESLDNMSKSGYNPYAFVPNVSKEADKFIAAFAGYLWQQGYTSAYMTDRDARKELTDQYGTDIEWLYEVTFNDDGPEVKVFNQCGKAFHAVAGEELKTELKAH